MRSFSTLAEQGMDMGHVVKMTAFLVGVPELEGRMDSVDLAWSSRSTRVRRPASECCRRPCLYLLSPLTDRPVPPCSVRRC